MHEIRAAGNGNEVLNWASWLDENAMQQAMRAARSPVVAGPLALMPDAHVGAGATIGSVIATKAEGPNSGIIPAAVGVDLGCGMIAAQTTLSASDLPDDLGPVLSAIEAAVPAGVGKGHDLQVTRQADRWLSQNPAPRRNEMDTKLLVRAAEQLGSLGGGNHFVEISLDEDDGVWIVLHSGSRGVGNVLASGHIRDARRLADELERALEDKDLAYFLTTDPNFEAYRNDVLWSQAYALANRQFMLEAVFEALRGFVQGWKVLEQIQCHHNYMALEEHDGRKVWITRKGAINAERGARGVIPGSMGTDTYIVTGLGNPASYNSAAHGAGRKMSRSAAKKAISVDDLRVAMEGRTWLTGSAESLIDEAPAAYKDIADVMEDQADLVRVDHRIHAILNYKGTA
jgi:tRNA-splicing ligase RtcB